MRLVGLLTDFGIKDPYVGMMKAVAYRICPDLKIVDITHNVPKYNILLGSHILRIVQKYSPPRTVFVGVVDPGVGSSRKPIILISGTGNIYIGPDNGLLVPAAEDEGIKEAYIIRTEVAGLRNISGTFHGRDIFMPAAALIACGVKPSSLGKKLELQELHRGERFPLAPSLENGALKVRVLHVDDFGNIITSIDSKMLQEKLEIGLGEPIELSVNKDTWFEAKYVKSFSHVCKGCLAVYEGSYNLIEVAVNLGNAASKLNAKTGNSIYIRK